MLIVEKCEKEKNNFFTNFENSLNNVYMCCDMNISNNPNKLNNNIYPNYTLDSKIKKNKLIKIQKVINSDYNNTKPNFYNKDNNKNNKIYYNKYIEANCKKITNYKKLI